jgi:hypothetical protein
VNIHSLAAAVCYNLGHARYNLRRAKSGDIFVYPFTQVSESGFGAMWYRVIRQENGLAECVCVGRCSDGARFHGDAAVGTPQIFSATWLETVVRPTILRVPSCAHRLMLIDVL